MNLERFTRLAEAYGADLRRWPAGEQATARDWARNHPGLAGPVLSTAGALDAALDAAPVPRPSTALRDRVLAAAPLRRRRTGRTLAWLSGLGWAAATCAGVVAGANLTLHLTADQRADAVLRQASEAGLDDLEVLG